MSKTDNSCFWDWLISTLLTILAGLTGVVFDHFSRAGLSFAKTGTFEVYVSTLVYLVLLPLTLIVGIGALAVSRKTCYPRLTWKLSILLTSFSISGFVMLMIFSS